MGSTKDRASGATNLFKNFIVGAFIKSEARLAVGQKRAAKLLTLIVLATKHAVCRVTFMLYLEFFYNIVGTFFQSIKMNK